MQFLLSKMDTLQNRSVFPWKVTELRTISSVSAGIYHFWVCEYSGNFKIFCQTQFRKFMNQESKIYRGENASLLCCWFDLASTSSLGDPSFLTKLLFNGHWGPGLVKEGITCPRVRVTFPTALLHLLIKSRACSITLRDDRIKVASKSIIWHQAQGAAGGLRTRIECVWTMFCWCLSVTHEHPPPPRLAAAISAVEFT